jgi:hypothetical protein
MMKRPAAAKVLLASGMEGSSDEDAGKAREQPAEDEASGDAEVTKVTKKILYSRTYRRERSKAKSEGCTDADAKARAQGAAGSADARGGAGGGEVGSVRQKAGRRSVFGRCSIARADTR